MTPAAPETARCATSESTCVRDSGCLHLLYHELTPAQTDYAYALSTDEFRAHLDLVHRARAGGAAWLWPEITFDDGHVSNVDYALPLLAEANVTARFFITAGWTAVRAGYMDWQQVRQLHAAGHHIGAHGWSHRLLTHCSGPELDRELRSARLLLEDKLSAPVTTMSLPGGRYDGRVWKACADAGYTQVYTSIPRAETALTAPLVGRLNLRSGTPLPWLEQVLRTDSPALGRLERQYKLKGAAQRMLGDRLYHKLWALLNREVPAAHAST